MIKLVQIGERTWVNPDHVSAVLGEDGETAHVIITGNRTFAYCYTVGEVLKILKGDS